MLLAFLISNILSPIVLTADGRAMLGIYAAQVGLLLSIGLAFRLLVIG